MLQDTGHRTRICIGISERNEPIIIMSRIKHYYMVGNCAVHQIHECHVTIYIENSVRYLYNRMYTPPDPEFSTVPLGVVYYIYAQLTGQTYPCMEIVCYISHNV